MVLGSGLSCLFPLKLIATITGSGRKKTVTSCCIPSVRISNILTSIFALFNYFTFVGLFFWGGGGVIS